MDAARLSDFETLVQYAAALDVTPAAQLPDSGAVAYGGAVVLNLPTGGAHLAHIADLAVTVNFGPADTPMTGTLDNFQAVDGSSLGGVLTISGGAFDPGADPGTAYQFTALLSGNLSDAGNTYVIDGDIAGDFRGRNGDAILGVVYGDITGPAGVDIFDGAFAATALP